MADDLAEKVRAHAVKMRDLMFRIENAPVQRAGAAIEEMKAEVEALAATADQASAAKS